MDAVRYAQSKGYTFRYWEICNEPWGMGGPDDDPWTADDYVAHVKAVYQAVKAQRPDLKVGASAGVGPFNVFGGTQAYDPILAKAAGFYDFIAPHFYCHLKNLDQIPFERITFEGNAWVLHSYVMKTRELLETYNPVDRRVRSWTPSGGCMATTMARACVRTTPTAMATSPARSTAPSG